MKNRLSLFVLMLMVFLLGISFQISYAEQLQTAPVNPDFLNYMNRPAALQATVGDGHGLGYVPGPVDLSHLNQLYSAGGSKLTYGVLPSTYDLRTTGKLSAVRDQGTCGSCWAFGTYASVESLLLPGEKWDFSENNLKNRHGFTLGHCDGGYELMAMAYLARWSGVINESDDPYNQISNESPLGLPVQKHLNRAEVILGADNLKQAVYDNGAVNVTMFWDPLYYNATTKAYYYTGEGTNHSVALVGWDDNFPASNFNVAPPGKGAFLIRNSWGPSWGDGGYFWISYYDSTAVFGGIQYYFEPTANHTRIYQYDELGWTDQRGYGTNFAWFGNIFTALGNDAINAVGFYATSWNESYEIFVYKDVSSTTDPRSGTLCTSATGSFTNAGYHTVTLPPCSVTDGSNFSIVVRANTPSYNYPIPVESLMTGYSDNAQSQPGRSFSSADGRIWNDVGADAVSDVCLKAFSTPNVAPTLGKLTPSGVTSAANIPQKFSAVYTDINGYTDIGIVHFLVILQPNDSNAILLGYDRTLDKLYLYNVARTEIVGNCTPGTAGTLSNSLVTLNCAATTVSGSGNDLTVNWYIIPTVAFGGTKNVYMLARDMGAEVAGWEEKGDWTIIEAPSLGDVNGDGQLNIVDALFVSRYASGLIDYNFNPAVADVNCDGFINIVDGLFIARKVAGLDVPSWCGL